MSNVQLFHSYISKRDINSPHTKKMLVKKSTGMTLKRIESLQMEIEGPTDIHLLTDRSKQIAIEIIQEHTKDLFQLSDNKNENIKSMAVTVTTIMPLTKVSFTLWTYNI